MTVEGPFVHTFTLTPEWVERLHELEDAWWDTDEAEGDPAQLYFGVVHVANWRWVEA
jgi:hypothetical protein